MLVLETIISALAVGARAFALPSTWVVASINPGSNVVLNAPRVRWIGRLSPAMRPPSVRWCSPPGPRTRSVRSSNAFQDFHFSGALKPRPCWVEKEGCWRRDCDWNEGRRTLDGRREGSRGSRGPRGCETRSSCLPTVQPT